MKTIIVIPGRLASTRLPGKLLLEESGKYLIQHVYEQARRVQGAEKVVIAADSEQLVAAAPRLPTETFGKMFNTQVQDMLTIVYLANLTRTQLALAEKLQAVALNSASGS